MPNFREVLTGIDAGPLLAELAEPEAWRDPWYTRLRLVPPGTLQIG
jgi:hypothetical protein